MPPVLWVLVTAGVFVAAAEVRTSLRMIAMAPAFPRGRMFSLTKIMPAINLGIEEVERRGVLPNHRINLTVVDTEESAIVGPVRFFNVIHQQGGKINLFLGPVEDYTLSPVGGYAPYWNAPILTPGGFSHDFKRRDKWNIKHLPVLVQGSIARRDSWWMKS